MGKLLVTLLLDKSHSMLSRRGATLEAVSAYISGLRDDFERHGGDPVFFNLNQFDSIGIEKTYVGLPISQVKPLTEETYVPRGSTPLIDAAFETILEVEAYVKENPDTRVVVAIQTDGQENTSTKHTWGELREKISERQALGWQFNFMGAGIDAYDQGSKMGISAASTMSYGDNLQQTATAFAATAQNSSAFRRGLVGSTAYSAEQKVAAGDKFNPSATTKSSA